MRETKKIGNKIVEARKRMNISQAEIAQRLFISPQAVGKWERGESMPDITTFNRLAEILDVDLNYFSETFQTVGPDPTPSKTLPDHSAESLTGDQNLSDKKAGKNLNVDMSGGDWVESDFSGENITDVSFKGSDVRKANFDKAKLTDCNLSSLDLSGASFIKSKLVRTNFSRSGLVGTTFTDVKLTDVKLTKTDLRNTIFESCDFNGVDFNKSDMRGLNLDNQTFSGVKFDNAVLNEVTFRGATLKNVSFRSPVALTNKYYRAIKTICFDGAIMDKLTYAVLKGIDADMSKVTVLKH